MSSIDPTQTLRHAAPLPSLNFSKLSKNPSQNDPLLSATTPQQIEPLRAHNMEFECDKGHTSAEGGRSIDNYDGDDFESDSDDGESEIETEGEGQSSFRGGERSDVEADRHDAFSDTQELDSSITNQYLRQLRYTYTTCNESIEMSSCMFSSHGCVYVANLEEYRIT